MWDIVEEGIWNGRTRQANRVVSLGAEDLDEDIGEARVALGL